MTLIYREATVEDAKSIHRNLREADHRELRAASGTSVLDTLIESVKMSQHSLCVTDKDGSVLLLGGCGASPNPDWGIPWMVCTDEAERHAVRLVRDARTYVAEWASHYSRLFNYVHAENHKSIEWLRRLGFKVKPTATAFGAYGARFHYFSMEGPTSV